MASLESRVPLPLPDKAGQGALYNRVQQLTKALAYHTERGEHHDAQCVVAQLDAARAAWLKLYNGKVQHE